MSNRDRIQRMAAEAKAADVEKKAKAKKKAVTKKKATTKKKAAAKKKAPAKKAAVKKKAAPRKKTSRSKAKARVKIVWAVCVPLGKALSIFPYREKAEAEAEAKRLTDKKGVLHVVRSERQPMTDDE